MNERWRYQFKTGTFWGVFMTGFMILFDIKEHSFNEQIANPNFWIRSFAYIAIGIFVLGYFNWRAKVVREKKE